MVYVALCDDAIPPEKAAFLTSPLFLPPAQPFALWVRAAFFHNDAASRGMPAGNISAAPAATADMSVSMPDAVTRGFGGRASIFSGARLFFFPRISRYSVA